MFLIGRGLMLPESFFPLGFGDHILAALVIEKKVFFVVDGGNDLALGFANGLGETLLYAFLLGEKFGIATQQDIRTTARHIRGDGDGAFASGLGYDFRFALVKLGVENNMADAFALQQIGERFGFFDRRGADKNWATEVVELLDLIGRSEIFFFFGAVD